MSAPWNYDFECPRCGKELSANSPDIVYNEVVDNSVCTWCDDEIQETQKAKYYADALAEEESSC